MSDETGGKGPYWISAMLDADVSLHDKEDGRKAETSFHTNVSFDVDGLTEQDVRLILVDAFREWADSLEADYNRAEEESDDD